MEGGEDKAHIKDKKKPAHGPKRQKMTGPDPQFFFATKVAFFRGFNDWFGVWITKERVCTYLYIPAARVFFRWVCPWTAGGDGGVYGVWGMLCGPRGPRLWSNCAALKKHYSLGN